MENDILSLFIINDDTKRLIKKNLILAYIIIILSIVYAVFDLFDWYKFLTIVPSGAYKPKHYGYNHIVRPLISITQIAISIIGHFMIYNGYKSLLSAIQNNDPVLLHNGFRKFYVVNFLTVTIFFISTMNIAYRYFLIK